MNHFQGYRAPVDLQQSGLGGTSEADQQRQGDQSGCIYGHGGNTCMWIFIDMTLSAIDGPCL